MILRPKKWSSSRLINLVKRSRRIKNFWFYSLIQWAQSSRWTLRKESRNFGVNMLNRSLNYTIYVIVSNLKFEHKIWYFLHFFWMFFSTSVWNLRPGGIFGPSRPGPGEFWDRVGPARKNFRPESARPGPGEFWDRVGPARPGPGKF